MSWDQLAAGSNCPFDPPREEANDFWDTVAQLDVSTLCLLKNQAYRGHCILIYDRRHAVRLDQLTEAEWAAFAKDLHFAVRAIMSVCRADHMNVECMGNRMPHLHWQIVPRYKTDPRWNAPIWTTTLKEFHDARLPEAERRSLLAGLREALH